MPSAPSFQPSDIERLAGVDPVNQRDWRRRGLLEGYGQSQASGRWLYSLEDVTAFYIARRLIAGGMDRQHAIEFGRDHAAAVVVGLQRDGAPTYRYGARLVFVIGGEAAQVSSHGDTMADLTGHLEAQVFDLMEVVDLLWLASSAPEPLRTAAALAAKSEG